LGPPRPMMLYHKPTARCDCRCRFCDFWKEQPEGDDSMPTEVALDLIDRAAEAGFTTYTLWGGEPLLVADLPVWLGRARSHGMQTVVCTSGYRLPERASGIGPHIERLLVSLEAVGKEHDGLRATPGLFDRVVEGLARFRESSSGEVTLWSNLTRENMDQVEPIARFAAEKGIMVEFFPAALYQGYNEDIVLDRQERAKVFNKALELKKEGLPVQNTRFALKLMASARPFKCNLARLGVQVDSDGMVYACEKRVLPDLDPYGAADELDLKALRRSREYKQAVEELSSCNRCLLPCVANMADGLFTQAMRKFAAEIFSR